MAKKLNAAESIIKKSVQEPERVETRGRKAATNEPKSESCTILLRRSTKAKISYLAWRDITSFNEYITRVLESHLESLDIDYPEDLSKFV